jgi:hypothetical protein
MMKCPKCQASLPDGAGFCQFCKAQWAAPPPARMARSGGVGSTVAGTGTRPWVWKAYYAIAAWWILEGAVDILGATVFATEKHANGGMFAISLGAFSVLVGLGLILKVDLVRSIVNVLAWLNILFGLLGIVMAFFMVPVAGIWGALLMLKMFLNIGLSGLML